MLFFSALMALTKLPDFDNFKWERIQDGKVRVEYYQVDDINWCRSYTITDYSVDEISKFLEDKNT